MSFDESFKETMDTSLILENVEWKFLSSSSRVDRVFYTELPNAHTEITYEIKIQRRTVFHLVNTILPCMLIGVLVGATFILPPLCGERIGFCVINLLTVLLFSLNVADHSPPSEEVPIMTSFLKSIFITTAAALLVTCISVRYSFLAPGDYTELPWFFRYFTNVFLAKITCIADKASTSKNINLEYVNETAVEMQSETENNLGNVTLPKESDKVSNDQVENNYEEQWRKSVKIWDRVFLFMYIVSLCGMFLNLYISVEQFVVR